MKLIAVVAADDEGLIAIGRISPDEMAGMEWDKGGVTENERNLIAGAFVDIDEPEDEDED